MSLKYDNSGKLLVNGKKALGLFRDLDRGIGSIDPAQLLFALSDLFLITFTLRLFQLPLDLFCHPVESGFSCQHGAQGFRRGDKGDPVLGAVGAFIPEAVAVPKIPKLRTLISW